MTQETGTQTDSSQLLTQNTGTTNVNCVFEGAYYDFSGRPLEEVVRIQHQLSVLQRQFQTQASSPYQPPSGSTSSTSVPTGGPIGSQTPTARKNPPRTRKKKDLPQHDILPTPQDTPEAPVESGSKEKERDPDYQFVETQGVDD